MLKKSLFALALIALLLSACASGQSYESMPAEGMYNADSTVPQAYTSDATEIRTVASNGLAPEPIERLVIKNAELAIIASDPEANLDQIAQMAETMNGYVVSSSLYQRTLSSGLTVFQGSITVRVPIGRLNEALAQIKAGAVEVERENVSGQDVTQEYTDLQSQLRNLEAAEAQLMQIMENATETEDVLAVYNELVYKREQIEIVKGRIQYYKEAAALSKIEVRITADEAARPLQVGDWQPVGTAKDAIEALISTLQFLADAGIWFVICILPIGLLIGLPLYLAGRVAWRARKQRKTAEPTPTQQTKE